MILKKGFYKRRILFELSGQMRNVVLATNNYPIDNYTRICFNAKNIEAIRMVR